jgi:hypothetical protein
LAKLDGNGGLHAFLSKKSPMGQPYKHFRIVSPIVILDSNSETMMKSNGVSLSATLQIQENFDKRDNL